MTPPPGRPKSGKNRDLPPRLRRRPSARSPSGFLYYYCRADDSKIPLGHDLDQAKKKWLEYERQPVTAASGFAALAKDFRDKYIPKRAPETQRQYEAMVDRLEAVFGTTDLSHIEPGDIGAMKESFEDSPVLFNRLRSVLSAMWNWARETGRTTLPNPCAGVHRYTERPAQGRITDAMYSAIYEHADQILRDWMDLSVTCGQRVNDVLRLRRADIYTESGRRYLDVSQGKTANQFGIEISGDLATVIDRLLTRARTVSGLYLIQTDAGQRVTDAMIRKRWEAARAAAEKEALAAGTHWRHINRKDLRSKSAQDAETIEEAQERLGHTDSKVTRRHYRRGTVARPGRLPRGEGGEGG